MKINETNLPFVSSLKNRKETKYIVLHHRAGDGDAESIHKSHLALGWSGAGYHFYVRKDGKIFSLRPEASVGAHASGFNDKSVGICFEGNFEKEEMSINQQASAKELIKYLREKYKGAEVKRHSDLLPTLCPGKNFPFDKVTKTQIESANDICWELKQRIKIEDTKGFVLALDKAKKENSPLYWGYFKIVNS